MRSGTVRCSSARAATIRRIRRRSPPWPNQLERHDSAAAPPHAGPRRARARPRPGRRSRARCRQPPVVRTLPRSRSSGRPIPRHGDLASNLAMKLARPCRMAPLAIAAALKEELDREIETDAAATPIARGRRGAARASSTCGSPIGRWRGDRCGARGARGLGHGRASSPTPRQRRVRVGQPDRSAHDRQRPRSVHR